MKCIKLLKENSTVFMLDSKSGILNLEDDRAIQKYEKTYNVNVQNMVNRYLGEKDVRFTEIINEIEKLVKKYNIDYFMYGDGKNVTEDSLALIYNLNNRNSYIDCSLKVFFSIDEPHKGIDRIRYMINFFSGSTRSTYGFDLFKHFDYDDFHKIKDELELYFSSDESKEKDIKVIDNCCDNIKNRIGYYYK